MMTSQVCPQAQGGPQLPTFMAAEPSPGCALVIELSAETLLSLEGSCISEMNGIRLNQRVFEPLVVKLGIVVRHELSKGRPQRSFAKRDEAFETGLFDAADEAFSIGAHVR